MINRMRGSVLAICCLLVYASIVHGYLHNRQDLNSLIAKIEAAEKQPDHEVNPIPSKSPSLPAKPNSAKKIVKPPIKKSQTDIPGPKETPGLHDERPKQPQPKQPRLKSKPPIRDLKSRDGLFTKEISEERRDKFHNLVRYLHNGREPPREEPREHEKTSEHREISYRDEPRRHSDEEHLDRYNEKPPKQNYDRQHAERHDSPCEAPRRCHKELPSDKHDQSHWKAFDKFRHKDGLLLSMPIETLQQLMGIKRYYHETHRPRERQQKPPCYKKHKPIKSHTNRPPKTINEPRKIKFDYSANIDTEGKVKANFQDEGVKYAAGSYQDQQYSEWFVVTKQGYEYDGDTKELARIFDLANKQRLPSTSDVIPDNLFNAQNTMSAIQDEPKLMPPDSRERVSNTDKYPFSVVGHLSVGCTGTLIGPRHVLTAGHCVYDYDSHKWFNKLDFHRGKDCDPDEGEIFPWELAITVRGWKDFGFPSYDYAVIVVSKSSPKWMNFGWSNSLHMADVQVVGYPTDKPGHCMWDTSCNIGQEWNELLGYKCDTSSGMSGGPVYRYEKHNERGVVYCVHAFGADDYNACAQITRPRFTQFINWISNYNGTSH